MMRTLPAQPLLSRDLLNQALLDTFEFSPVAICMTTTEIESRYVKVNPAYLQLIERSWEEIASGTIALDLGTPLDDPRRLRRLHTLETQGFYKLEEVFIRRRSGELVPTLVSAQRRVIQDTVLDIEIIIENSERKAFEAAITRMAYTDTITDLPNRKAFNDMLDRMMEETKPGEGVGLAFIDLNGFKKTNDYYGHDVGDRLLSLVGQRLRQHADPEHFVARLGGDEFAILFRSAGKDGHALRADFLRLGEAACRDLNVNGLPLSIGMAIGVAIAGGTIAAQTLLQRADALMYLAKAGTAKVDVRMQDFADF